MAKGFATMTSTGPRLREAGKSVDGYDCVYGLASLTQVSSTQVVAALGRRPSGVAVVDYEDGVDFVLFDKLVTLADATPQPAFRNDLGEHPQTGDPLVMTKYPAQAGFVPLGAKRADGSDHPHAGTGFALSLVVGYPAGHDLKRPERQGGTHNHWELAQLSFDASQLKIEHLDVMQCDEVLPGDLVLFRQAIQTAVADGDDFLMPLVAGPPNEAPGCGVTRWLASCHVHARHPA